MNRLIISVIMPWILTGALALLVSIAILSIPAFFRGLKKLPAAIIIMCMAIFFLGAYIRFAWVPNTHRIYFDEDRYLMYAVSFARTGHALGIQIATPNNVLLGDPDPGARVTVPLIHSWIMKFFGYTDKNLFLSAKIFSSLQIVLIFIFVLLLFGRPVAALSSALIIAFIPIMVFWSTTTNLDSLFVFFALISGIGATWYAKRPTILRALFFASGVSLLLFVRIEGMILLVSLLWLIITVRKHENSPVLSNKDIPFLLLFLPIFITRIVVALPLFSQTWCCAEATPLEIFQLGYFWRNTIPNLQTLFVQKEFPFIITLLSMLTLFRIGSSTRHTVISTGKIWIFVIWVFTYFMLYSFYYVGIFYSYTFSGSYGRFFLMLVPPLIILASISIDYGYAKFVSASHKHKTHILGITLLLLLTLYPTITTYRTTIAMSPWDRLVDEGPRLMRAFLTDDLIPNTPQNALIIHPLTAAILMSNRSAVSVEALVFQQKAIDFVKAHLQQGKPAYMLATDVCEATPYKCRLIGDTFIYTPLDIPNQKTPAFSALSVTLNTTHK